MRRIVCSLWLLFAAYVHEASAVDCASVAGDWNWSIGALVTFKTDRVVLLNGAALGRWECTNSRFDVATVLWSTGFVYTMMFTGERVSAENQSCFTRLSAH
jgi:hypothetical protein